MSDEVRLRFSRTERKFKKTCNKLEDFEALLRSENAAVAAVTEIWNLDDGLGQTAGYSSFLSARSSSSDNWLGTGVGIYVWKDISCKPL